MTPLLRNLRRAGTDRPTTRNLAVTLDLSPHLRDTINWPWPYACHRHGHIYTDADRCTKCGLPWRCV